MIKLQEYFNAGTQIILLIHPKTKTVHIYKSMRDVRILSEDDTIEEIDLLNGFECKVTEFFNS